MPLLGRFLLKMGECVKFLSTESTARQILFSSQGYWKADCCWLETGVAVSVYKLQEEDHFMRGLIDHH